MGEAKEEMNVKAPNLIERVMEEIEAVAHKEKTHHKETHGMSNDINENTPIEKVKGPNVFERAKEEFEAIGHSIHGKRKENGHEHDGEKGRGFVGRLGRLFQKFCSPSNGKRD